MLTELQASLGTYALQLRGVRGGGQAIIYRAEGPSGQVAIKVARELADNRWLAHERDALRSLRESGASWVVPLLDHGQTPDGRVFVVLPWFEQTLRDWLETDPPLVARLLAMSQACEALIRLHRSLEDLSSIRLHRDIKPANFLIRTEPEVQVILADLGGVKEGRLLSVGQQTMMHTPHFAPPEQELPIDRALDPSADVHALGVSLYWAIVGDVPRAVYLRRTLFSAEVQRLYELCRRQHRLSKAEADEYHRLRQLPLRDLFQLDVAEALSAADRNRLQQHILDLLAEDVAVPAVAAERLCSLLIPALERALSPDPERRAADARQLLAACREAVVYLQETAGMGRPSGRGSATGEEASPAAAGSVETLLQPRAEGAPAAPLRPGKALEVGGAAIFALALVALVSARGIFRPGGAASEHATDGSTESVPAELAAQPPPAELVAESPPTEAAVESSSTGLTSAAAPLDKLQRAGAVEQQAASPRRLRPLAPARLFLRPGDDGAALLAVGGEVYPDKHSFVLSGPQAVELMLDGTHLCTLEVSSAALETDRWRVVVGDQSILAAPEQTVVARYSHRCSVSLSLK